MLLISIVCTVCYLLEKRYHRPVLSRLFNRDASQNVVVKYRPEAAVRSGSRRKIIVVANYDSGRVRKDLKPGLLKAWSVLGHASYVAMIAAPIVLFFKNIVFANALGFVSGFFSLLAIIAAVLLVVPVVREIIHRTGAYNEAANVNASSIAVLLNLMRRIGNNAAATPLVQQDANAQDAQPVVHGYDAAQAAGVVPDGAELHYEDVDSEQRAAASEEPPSNEDGQAASAAMTEEDTAAETHSDNVPDSTQEAVADEGTSDASRTAAAAEEPATADSEQQADTETSVEQPSVATASSEAVQEQLPVQEVIEPEPAAMPSEDQESPEGSAAERLRAAKAAIAALTGEPVDDRIYARDIVDEPVNVTPQPIDVPDEQGQERMRADMMSALGGPQVETISSERDVDMNAAEPVVQPLPHNEPPVASATVSATPAATVAAPASSSVPATDETLDEIPVNKPQVPDWYRSAQEKARRSDKRVGAVHRSRYADALDSAVRESSVFFSEANKLVDEETESRLQNMRRGISEVRAPQLSDVDTGEPAQRSAAMGETPADGTSGATSVSETRDASEEKAPEAPVVEDSAAHKPSPAAPSRNTHTVPTPTQAIPAERNDAVTRGIDATSIPAVPQADQEPQGRPERHDDAARNKVLEEDPSLGRTVAMKPIHMPTADERNSAAQPGSRDATAHREPRPLRPRVKLPEVPSANMAPITDSAKQRAPLAQAAEVDGKTAAKSLLSHTIPKIDVDSLSGDLGEPITDNGKSETKRQNLIDHLPSLSGSIASETSKENGASDTIVSATGSFTAVSATGTFAPVGDELVADVDPEDRYVDDADDSVHAGGVTESGAFAGPDYVDMPKSRRSRFFSHFHRKNKKADQEETPQQWLDVEDDFDARTVGRERGDWDSFQEGDARAHAGDRQPYEESAPDAVFEGYEEYDANDGDVPNGTYRQGVIYESQVTYDNPISKPVDNQASYSADIIDEEPVDESSEPLGKEDKDEHRWQGGAFSGIRSKMRNPDPQENTPVNTGAEGGRVREDDAPNAGRQESRPVSNERPAFDDNVLLDREIEDVYEFAQDSLDTEVWFVALGAQEEGDNAGMKSFLATHGDELRGAYVVSLESMGAGVLGFGNTEGIMKKHAPSTRLKRFLHTASQSTGIKLIRSDQTWRESAASVAMDNGVQAVSLMGLDGDKPAFYAQSDDVLENIDEQQVRRNADYLWEFLKSF